MMMGNSSSRDHQKPMHLLHGPRVVLSSTGISHHHCLFSHYFINFFIIIFIFLLFFITTWYLVPIINYNDTDTNAM